MRGARGNRRCPGLVEALASSARRRPTMAAYSPAMEAPLDPPPARPDDAGFLAGYEHATFEAGGIAHPILRGSANGPIVIVIHELPGVTQRTIAVADRIGRAGFRVVLPELLERGRLLGNLRTVCVAAEFRAFARRASRPVVDWLRALAASEYARAGSIGPGVGVVGMCFSGGFAFAMVADPIVEAAVASQPALPFPFPGVRDDVGASNAELQAIAGRGAAGFAARTLRYQRDPLSPSVRHRRIRTLLPATATVEIRTWNPLDHPVLANAISAQPGTSLADALDGTIAYLAGRLRPGPAPSAPTERSST